VGGQELDLFEGDDPEEEAQYYSSQVSDSSFYEPFDPFEYLTERNDRNDPVDEDQPKTPTEDDQSRSSNPVLTTPQRFHQSRKVRHFTFLMLNILLLVYLKAFTQSFGD
jgi:hypothetical protein